MKDQFGAFCQYANIKQRRHLL